jgi:hypothetical protein
MIGLLLYISCCLFGLPISSASYPEVLLISGIADTAQTFGQLGDGSEDLVRHHLVCFQQIYQPRLELERCCNQFYLKGTIDRDQIQYCLDHLAVVAPVESFGDVKPAYYLSIDTTMASHTFHAQQVLLNNRESYSQHRNLQVVEDNERENSVDGYKGVDAFSPFHLTGFMPSGLVDDETLFPLYGIVQGNLSNGGGMHRSFRQTVHLSFMDLPKKKEAAYRLDLNATILLPIKESVFIDADDPFVIDYERDFPDGVKCKTTIVSGDTSAEMKAENGCDIEFSSSEVIDIEQPSFSSRQYVVVYHIHVSLDFNESHYKAMRGGLALDIDFATTLHIRYLSPAVNGDVVPIVIQQPLLYSAVADIYDRRYILQTNATASEYGGDNKWSVPQPIIVNVAAGIDDDYWWVTLITMSAAVIGGIAVITSIDSISDWV